MKSIKKWILSNPAFCFPLVASYKLIWIILAKLLSDEQYIKLRFRYVFHKPCNLNNPLTFNEKLNWMKLYERDPKYTLMANKYLVKDYVRRIIGDVYVVPNYGCWKSFKEIEFDSLPNQFVLKATHDSSGATICKDKFTFDKRTAKSKFDKCLKRNYFYLAREWVYKDVEPMIIADMLLDDNTGSELTDYKFWCFNGEPKVMYITNKGEHIYENFYDMNYNVLDIDHGFPRRLPEYQKPKEFELMKELAAKLSAGISFVRIDFFDVNGKVYFGEYTFYDWGGFGKFKDDNWDIKLGSWIKLPVKKMN